jgi:hypothetical protein
MECLLEWVFAKRNEMPAGTGHSIFSCIPQTVLEKT